MAAKPNLRVATVDDAKPKTPRSMIETVEAGGTYLEILIAQRLEMMRDVKDVTGPAKAALHRQIALHSREIAQLEANAKGEKEDAENAEVGDGDFDASAV